MTGQMEKLRGLEKGDRVRIQCEGVIDEWDAAELYLKLDGHEDLFNVLASSVAAPTFQIERIEPPLSVDDLVRLKRDGKGGLHLAVRAIVDDRAWVTDAAMGAEIFEAIVWLSDLERIA